MSKRFAAVAAAAFAAAFAITATEAAAQTVAAPPVLVILDKDALDYGPPPHLLPDGAVNPDIAGTGVREELPYFQNHIDGQVVLTGGQNGNDGWFALTAAPSSWVTGDGSDDALENFASAGPGLGSPDESGDRESLLDNTPGVVPLRADGLALLVGRTVCAVIYAGDVTAVPGGLTSLKGPTLGRVAFTVVSLAPTGDSARPNVQVQIMEGHEVCSGQLAPLSIAPAVP